MEREMNNAPIKFDLEFDYSSFKKELLNNENKKQYDLIKRFFGQLITAFHDKASNLESKLYELNKEHFVPQILLERNQYSLFAAALDDITPIHLSEWGISCSNGEKINRRIDYWCLYTGGKDKSDEKINFFIELKRNDYCLSENSPFNMRKTSAKSIKNLEGQLRNIRSNPLKWEGDGEYYLGILVTTCWLGKTADLGYDIDDAKSAIRQVIHGNSKTHIMQAHYELDDNYETQDIYDDYGKKLENYYKTKYVVFTGFLVEKK